MAIVAATTIAFTGASLACAIAGSTMWNCLEEFGAPLRERFMQRYVIAHIDQDRLTYNLLPDELF